MWMYLKEECVLMGRELRRPLMYVTFLLLLGSAALYFSTMVPWERIDLSQVNWLYLVPYPVALLAALFAWMTAVDMREMVLPDLLTLPGLALGIYFAPQMGLLYEDALIGAAIGGGVFGAIALGSYLVRKQQGLGIGDIKLLALIGAWGGWMALLPTLLISSFAALFFLGIKSLLGTYQARQALPFGPFLILGGWLSLLWGHLFWSHLIMLSQIGG